MREVQREMSGGSVWLMELLVRMRVVRLVKRQRIEVGSGPARLKLERLI